MKSQLILAFVSSIFATKCGKPALRREIRELTEGEVRDFVAAMDALQQEKDESGMSTIERFSQIHAENIGSIHATANFLPWHRAMLHNMERELQRINPAVVLPYWDWSLDSQSPHNSPVLSPMFVGGTGDKDRDYCVADGPFANWTMNYPTPHCLRRAFNDDDEASPLPLPESILLAVNEPTFSEFSEAMEIKQSYLHTTMGGHHGDMTPTFSPNDPLFYLHHAFVDLVWAKWQRKHPAAAQYEGDAYMQTTAPGDMLVPFATTVNQVLDTEGESLCYAYPNYPSLIFAPSVPDDVIDTVEALAAKNPIVHGDYANETITSLLAKVAEMPQEPEPQSEYPSRHRSHPRFIEPLPGSFIRENNLDAERVSTSEANEKALVEFVDKSPSFVSIASLQARINRFYL